MEKNREKIKCSVGVLTYNSAKTLEICLASLKDFAEIIICDGGSEDSTLEIAEKYHCKIIKQTEQGVISDYGRERNKILDESAYDWHFYLDSDEILSTELSSGIRNVCCNEKIDFYVYDVIRLLISPDLKIRYKEYKKVYQNRFFNKKCGARFGRVVNERIFFDREKYKIGRIEAGWCVVFDDLFSFKIFRAKTHTRVKMYLDSLDDHIGKNIGGFAWKEIISSLRGLLGAVYRIVYVRLRYDWKEVLPIKFELFRMYNRLFNIVCVIEKCLSLKIKDIRG